ncbi:hypothetical protein JCM10450v2_007689 [Rhodotorula kratochvilovae]
MVVEDKERTGAAEPLMSGRDESEPESLELEEMGGAGFKWAREPAELAKERRYRLLERVAIAVLALLVVLLAVEPRSPSTVVEAGKKLVGLAEEEECDPYDLPGVLRFDYENHTANFWEPALSSCKARDYMNPLAFNDDEVPELEFMRGRVVMYFGDSVDRFALQHFCNFLGGQAESITRGHPLMPPLPKGREHAPDGYRSYRNTTDWPASEMGVPHLCRVQKYDFHLLNVFQFGLFPEDESVMKQHHFLPPGDYEGRFDTFVVPLLEKYAANRTAERNARIAANPLDPSLDISYPISAAPDLFVTTPTFWNIMRYPQEYPLPSGEWAKKLLLWTPPTRERQDWWEGRVQQAVTHVAKAWGGAKGNTKIIWRRLHMVYRSEKWPVTKLLTQDAVAAKVVELLKQESAAAESRAGWARWTQEVVPTLGPTWFTNRTREEVQEMGLAARVKILEWGKVFNGQQFHGSGDGVHPDPLPGSWVYHNMWIDVLRRHVESQR